MSKPLKVKRPLRGKRKKRKAFKTERQRSRLHNWSHR